MGPGGRGSLPPQDFDQLLVTRVSGDAWNPADLSLPSGTVPFCVVVVVYEPQILPS